MKTIFSANSSYIPFFLLLSSCVTVPYKPYAREVKKLPGKGGVIALKSDHRSEDRTFADKKMTKNCKGNKMEVLQESEVSVGTKTDTVAEEAKGRKKSGVLSIAGLSFTGSKPSMETETSSVVTNVTEWQIEYRCL